MSFSIPFFYQKSLTLKQSREEVFQKIRHYDRLLPDLFPGLKRFHSEGDEIYSWEFEPITYGGKDLCVSFRTQFAEPAPFELTVVPIGSTDDTRLRGSWKVVEAPNGCKLDMNFHLELSVPLPKFTKSFIAPLAETELNKLFNRYTSNVEQTFK